VRLHHRTSWRYMNAVILLLLLFQTKTRDRMAKLSLMTLNNLHQPVAIQSGTASCGGGCLLISDRLVLDNPSAELSPGLAHTLT